MDPRIGTLQHGRALFVAEGFDGVEVGGTVGWVDTEDDSDQETDACSEDDSVDR